MASAALEPALGTHQVVLNYTLNRVNNYLHEVPSGQSSSAACQAPTHAGFLAHAVWQAAKT